MELSERNRNILKAVILSYIDMAFPVGSQTVTRNYSIGLSPATIRNIMADLEELGYLVQPHTSAGRIPTEKAYRLYVDEMVDENLPSFFNEQFLEEQYLGTKREDIHVLLQETTRMLSLLSHYAGVVLAPNVSKDRLHHIEFIPMRRGHALVIQVSKDDLVQHRVVEVDPTLTRKDLRRIGTILNDKFSGKTLDEVRRQLLTEMKNDKDLYDTHLEKALELARSALAEEPNEELYVEGTANMLDLPDFSDLENMRSLFKAFEEKANILKLLNQCMETTGVQILIGSEMSDQGFNECSMVASSYRNGSHTWGTLGIIGPTRMDYARVIPLVDHTARLLGRLLERI